jgi:hypothetical protein
MPAHAPADVRDRVVWLMHRRIGVVQKLTLSGRHLRPRVEIGAAQNNDSRARTLYPRVSHWSGLLVGGAGGLGRRLRQGRLRRRLGQERLGRIALIECGGRLVLSQGASRRYQYQRKNAGYDIDAMHLHILHIHSGRKSEKSECRGDCARFGMAASLASTVRHTFEQN